MVWAVGAAGRMISWLFWGSPEMQETGLKSLPLFIFSHRFHFDLGGRRAVAEDAPRFTVPKTSASQVSKAGVCPQEGDLV